MNEGGEPDHATPAEGRALLHLLRQKALAPPELSAPFVTTQEGMGDVIGTSRRRCRELLGQLEEKGLVCRKKVSVMGAERKRFSYYLTSTGMRIARELEERAGGDPAALLSKEKRIAAAIQGIDAILTLDLTGEGKRVLLTLAEMVSHLRDVGNGVRIAELLDRVGKQTDDPDCLIKAALLRGQSYEYKSLWDLAGEEYEAALATALEIENVKAEIIARRGLGRVKYKTGNLQEAASSLEECLALAGEIDGDVYLAVLIDLGSIYGELRKRKKALKYLDEAERLAVGDEPERIRALNNRAYIRVEWGDFDTAISEATAALESAGRIGDEMGRVHAIATLAYASGKLGNAGDALRYGNEGVKLSKASSNVKVLGGCYVYLGIAHSLEGDWEQSIQYFEKGLALQDRADSPLYSAILRMDFADTLLKKGDVKGAKKVLREALRFARMVGVAPLVRAIERELKKLG